jgi:hypothetical protein
VFKHAYATGAKITDAACFRILPTSSGHESRDESRLYNGICSRIRDVAAERNNRLIKEKIRQLQNRQEMGSCAKA